MIGSRHAETLAEAARRLQAAARRRWRVSLPALFLMSDETRLPDPESVLAGLPKDAAVIFRHYGVPDRRARAAALVIAAHARGIRVLVAGDWRLARAVGADGLHLPEAMVRRGPWPWRRERPRGWLLTAAAHSAAALRRAARAGADAALLGPAFPTASHPGRPALGALRFAALARRSPLPVVAVGGLTAARARRLLGSGAAGAAGIGGIARIRPIGQ